MSNVTNEAQKLTCDPSDRVSANSSVALTGRMTKVKFGIGDSNLANDG